MTNYNPTVDKQSPLYQENLIKTARYNLLVVIIFTTLNLVMLLTGGNRYFLFSTTIPYYLTFFGYMFDHYAISTYTLTGLMMAAVFLAAYVVCWFLCKKHIGWYITALVLISVDTLVMAVLILWSGNLREWITEIVFHVWVIISLSRGIAAANRLKQFVPAPEPPQYTLYTDPESDF